MIIHPGFLKTATTTLQTTLFSAHPALFSISRASISEAFRRVDGIDYDEHELRHLIDAVFQQKPTGSISILSDETLTANVFLVAPIARRLHALFPDARILFTIRHQLDSIRSFYARHGRVLVNVPAPYTDRHIAFPDWLSHAYANQPTSYLGAIDYYRTIRVYERLFGRERIQILLYETLKYEPDLFAGQIAGVLGIDPPAVQALLAGQHAHAQESARAVLYDRFLKRWIPRRRLIPLLPYTVPLRRAMRSFLNRGAPGVHPIPAEWIPRLEALYRSGNQALMSEYHLPLEGYDYPR